MFFILIIILMIISWSVQYRLKSKFKKYSKIPLSSGMSGREVAERMLAENGIRDVTVESVPGKLTDHYNPANKTVNLSPEVYQGRSAAAAAVAAHECGHAIQHATAYSWLELRSSLVPIQAASGKILNIVVFAAIFGGFLFRQAAGGLFSMDTILLIIIACYSVLTLFSLVTLPVEFDASKRALAWIDARNVVTPQEHGMAKDALNTAAQTYVVAALSSLVTLLYYIMIFLGRRD